MRKQIKKLRLSLQAFNKRRGFHRDVGGSTQNDFALGAGNQSRHKLDKHRSVDAAFLLDHEPHLAARGDRRDQAHTRTSAGSNNGRPKLAFTFDKTFLSPARLIHSLALTAIFAGSFKIIGRRIPAFPGFLCLLGRNSLNVFCALSLLSLSGQIFRFIYGGHVASDAFIVILGVLLMGFIAWAAEWRERLRAALANKPQSL